MLMDIHVSFLEKLKIVVSLEISLSVKTRFLLFRSVFSKENSPSKEDFKSLQKSA